MKEADQFGREELENASGFSIEEIGGLGCPRPFRRPPPNPIHDFPEFLNRLREFIQDTGAEFWEPGDGSIRLVGDQEVDPLIALTNEQYGTGFTVNDLLDAADLLSLSHRLAIQIAKACDTPSNCDPEKRDRIFDAIGIPPKKRKVYPPH